MVRGWRRAARMPHRCPVKERFWRDMLARFDAEDGNARDFCKRHRLAESAFYFWRRELSQRDAQDAAASPKPSRPVAADDAVDNQDRGAMPRSQSAADGEPASPLFREVVIRPATPRDSGASGAPIDLRLRGGHVLRIRPGFDEDTLRQLLQLLAPSTPHREHDKHKHDDRNGHSEGRNERGEQPC